jgi:hypothetical protein
MFLKIQNLFSQLLVYPEVPLTLVGDPIIIISIVDALTRKDLLFCLPTWMPRSIYLTLMTQRPPLLFQKIMERLLSHLLHLGINPKDRILVNSPKQCIKESTIICFHSNRKWFLILRRTHVSPFFIQFSCIQTHL